MESECSGEERNDAVAIESIAAVIVEKHDRCMGTVSVTSLANLITNTPATKDQLAGLDETQCSENKNHIVATFANGDELRAVLMSCSHEFFLVADHEFSWDKNSVDLLLRNFSGGFSGLMESRSTTGSLISKMMSWVVSHINGLLFGCGYGAGKSAGFLVSKKNLCESLEGVNHWPNIENLVGLLKTERVPIKFSRIIVNSPSIPAPSLKEGTEWAIRSLQFWWAEIKFPAPATSNKVDVLSGKQRLLLWGVLAILTWLVLSLNLEYPLFEPDESRNAQLAMNIVNSGEWFSLQLGGQPYWDKPPLMAWCTAKCYQWLGVSAEVTRLPANAAAFFSVMLVFGLGRRLVGDVAAWLGALSLLLSFGFVICARYVTADSVLTCLTLITLFSAFLACRGPHIKWHWWLFSSVGGALGLLAKGPVIIVLTLPVLVAHHMLTGNKTLLRFRPWAIYSIPVLLIAAPWYLAMSIVHPDFLSYFFWRHHVLRFSDAFNHQEPWWYFAPVLLIAMFPSSFLIPSLGRWLWKSGRRGEDQLSMEVGFLVMFSCWILFFFSLSEAKLPTYILPAFPAVSLLLGSMLRKRLFQQDFVTPQQDWFWQVPLHSSRVLFLGVALAILAGFFIQNRQNDLSEIWLLSLLLVAISLLSFVQIFHDPRLWRWLASAGLGLLLIGIVVEMLVPIISYQRSIYVAAREIKRQPGCDTLPIVFFEHEDYGSDLWFRDQEAIYFDDEDSRQMVRFLKSKQHVLIISRDHDVHELSKNLEWPLAISKVADARHLYFCHDRQEKVSVPKLDESWSENRD